MQRSLLVCLCMGAIVAGGLGAVACRRTSLLPRSDGAAVVVAAAPVAGDQDVTFVAEVEPNDNLTSAQKAAFAVALTPLGIAGQIAAPVGKTHDVDLFRLIIPPAPITGPVQLPDAATVVQRWRLSVTVEPDPALAVMVDALDDQGQTLLSATGGAAGEADGFPNLTVTPGVYHVRVRAAGTSSGGYRLVARLAPLEAGEESEPNGKAALASEAPATGEVVGYHGWRHDQDWYRIPLAAVPEGSVLGADLEAVPGVTASLLVYDAAERRLVESRGRSDERVSVRNVKIPPGDPQLFIVVRTDAGSSSSVRYNLRLSAELPKTGSELEPNNDPAHAQAIADGDTLGFLGRGDVDVYRYATPAGLAELDIEVAPPERVDAKLEIVRESDGSLLLRADAGKRHEAARIPNLFSPGAGALLIRLSAGKNDGNSDEPYRLTINSRALDPGAEREPNGTAAAATVLPTGIVGNGLIFPRADVDVWKTPLPAGSASATVTVTGIAGLTQEVRVLADDEHELGRFKVTGAVPVSSALPTGGAGCCLVQIRDASAKSAAPNPRDRYSLAVAP